MRRLSIAIGLGLAVLFGLSIVLAGAAAPLGKQPSPTPHSLAALVPSDERFAAWPFVEREEGALQPDRVQPDGARELTNLLSQELLPANVPAADRAVLLAYRDGWGVRWRLLSADPTAIEHGTVRPEQLEGQIVELALYRYPDQATAATALRLFQTVYPTAASKDPEGFFQVERVEQEDLTNGTRVVLEGTTTDGKWHWSGVAYSAVFETILVQLSVFGSQPTDGSLGPAPTPEQVAASLYQSLATALRTP